MPLEGFHHHYHNRQLQFLDLPNELLLEILRYLPTRDVYFGVGNASSRFKKLIAANLNTLPKFDVHCRVDILNSNPLISPNIEFLFTVFDNNAPDYEQKRRLCLSGNDRLFRELVVSHNYHDGVSPPQLIGQFDISGYLLDDSIVKRLLSYTRLIAIRFHVQKQCRLEALVFEDEFLAECLSFCEEHCQSVQISSLLLSSKSPLFPWALGSKSLKKLHNLPYLDTLILENMNTLNLFDYDENNLRISAKRLTKLHLKLDHRHRMDVDDITRIDLDGYFLLNLMGKMPLAPLDISIYHEIPALIVQIEPHQMCAFIRYWRNSNFAQSISQIVFNSTVSITDFCDAAFQMRLFQNSELMQVPYCRFHSIHTKDKDVVLKLACYANGEVTQWNIQTGALKTAGHKRSSS